MPILDLAQDRFDIFEDRALPQSGVGNGNQIRGDLVGKISSSSNRVRQVRIETYFVLAHLPPEVGIAWLRMTFASRLTPGVGSLSKAACLQAPEQYRASIRFGVNVLWQRGHSRLGLHRVRRCFALAVLSAPRHLPEQIDLFNFQRLGVTPFVREADSQNSPYLTEQFRDNQIAKSRPVPTTEIEF